MGERVVWKYVLHGVRTVLDVPLDAEILYVAVQQQKVTLWMQVDPRRPRERRTFLTVATGEPLPEDAERHIGSVMTGPFVFHVFAAPLSSDSEVPLGADAKEADDAT